MVRFPALALPEPPKKIGLPFAFILSIFFLSPLLLGCAANNATPAQQSPQPNSDTVISTPAPQPTATPIPTPSPTPTFEELKADSELVPYNNLFRNNEEHIGKRVWYQAQVVQVIEKGRDKYELRVDVTRGDYFWENTVFLFYSGSRLLEEDIIEFVGIVEELVTYEAIFGNDVTIPAIRVIDSRLVAEAGDLVPILAPTRLPTATPIATATPYIAVEPTPGPTPTPTPRLAPTLTPTPTPTPTPLPPGLTLNYPVEAGSVLTGSDGMEIVVTAMVEDAWGMIHSENPYNEPPGQGQRFYMVTVAVAYPARTGSIDVSNIEFKLVGDKRVGYSTYENSCGVIPNSLSGEIFPGGKTQGNICFEVDLADANFVLIHEPLWVWENARRFLALDVLRVGSRSALTVGIPEPDPAALALPPGLSLDNPVLARGVLEGSDGTQIVVLDVVGDAWEIIRSQNFYNEPPEPGNSFYMVTFAVANPPNNVSVDVSELGFKLVGDNRVAYSSYEYRCGEIPNHLSGEIFPGGKTQGNICFEVTLEDGNFILIHEPWWVWENPRRFLRVK